MHNSLHLTWLALTKIHGLGLKTLHKLLHIHSSPHAILSLSKEALTSLNLSPNIIHHIQHPPWKEATKTLTWVTDNGIQLITFDDPNYPSLLKHIPCPPLLLYVKGNIKLLTRPQLAIVGSRHPTPGARNTAKYFAQQLSQQELVITSGLAQGIDQAAHLGALMSGSTIAVLGTGIDIVYPKQNSQLSQSILKNGALLTEFDPHTPPKAHHFPQRNRIISGLSLGTLVIEAAKKSGSLITAQLAADHGREVFAIPGSIHNPLTQGCHNLIQQGAKLTQSIDDILQELPWSPSSDAIQPTIQQPPQTNAQTHPLLKYIGYETTTIDQCVLQSGLKTHEVTTQLLQLELANYINRVPGGYIRVVNYESNQ